jgi:hypothetical protein
MVADNSAFNANNFEFDGFVNLAAGENMVNDCQTVHFEELRDSFRHVHCH